MVLAGCGGAGSVTEIPSQDPELLEEGRRLFAEKCAECHGEDPRGTDRDRPSSPTSTNPAHDGDRAFILAVQTGVRAHHRQFGHMPPVEGLTAEDVEAIIAYVRATQRLEGFEP